MARLVVMPEVVSTGYDETARRQCYELWATRGGMSYRRTARLYARMMDGQGPDHTTIREWAVRDGWHGTLERDWQGGAYYLQRWELENRVTAGEVGALDTMLDAMAGEYDDDPMAGAVRLKGAELFMRNREKGVFHLPLAKDREAAVETGLSEEEAEMAIKERMQRRKLKA